MRKMMMTALACLLAMGAVAQAATLSLTIVINGPPSVSIACPLAASYSAPLAAGAVICSITESPSGWSGSYSLSGANAALFAIASGTGGQQLVVGSAGIAAAGSYAVTLTATP